MLIQCTKKLLDQLKIKPEPRQEGEPLFSWHANFLTINHRKAVVLVNDSNRYVIVLYGLLAKDFKIFDKLIFKAIQTVFREEGITDEVIKQFIEHAPTITYTKTKDQSVVARMNASIKPVYFFSELLDDNIIVQPKLSFKASRHIFRDGKEDYLFPNRELYSDLRKLTGKEVIQMEAVQIKATLNLENFQVWRRIEVPLRLTFRQLHNILQAAFGWQDYHLHEFYIYENELGTIKNNELNINHPAFHSKGRKPIVNIVSSEEAFDYGDDTPMKLDTGIKLSDYFPTYKSLRYNYDFGDGWQHNIEIESFINSSNKNYPVCLEGEGNTPPEDVGGEYGYEEFLKIIADQNHPDHENMVAWGRMQRYSDFDIKMVNIFIEDRLY